MLRLRILPFSLIALAGAMAAVGMSGCSKQEAQTPAKPAAATEQKAAAPAAVPPAAPAPQQSAAQQMPMDMPMPMDSQKPMDMYAGGAHLDHNPKHGGEFFMALDEKHHLEGVLDPPGVLKVYLYDAYTHPVSREQMDQAQMTVIWGEQDSAPKIDLKPLPDGTLLEAHAPGAVHFPVTLTLLARFPGMAASAKRELFTFQFNKYSHPSSAEAHTHPGGP